MPAVCSICSSTGGRSNPTLACRSCAKSFHIKCVGINSALPEFEKFPGLAWNCTSCLNAPSTTDGNTLSIILSKLNNMQQEMAEMKNIQADTVKSLEFYGTKIDEFNSKMQKVDVTLKTVSGLSSDMKNVKSEVNDLKEQVDNLEQHLRLNNLEINGVPEKPNENLLQIVTNIFNVLGFNNIATMVEKYHRVAHMNPGNQTPRSIIITLNRRSDKDSILRSIRQRKGMNVNEIGFSDKDNQNKFLNIYINEHLTPAHKNLFRKARDLCKKNKNYKCWSRDGKIYFLDSSGKPKHISNENALLNIR